MTTRPALTGLLLLALATLAQADEAADARRSQARFGGEVVLHSDYHLEVTIADEGVRIYPMDTQGSPAALFTMGGEALIRSGQVVRRRIPFLFVPGSEAGPGHLAALADVTTVADDRYELVVTLTGFPDIGEEPLQFDMPFRRTPERH
jgi:hypothetical protein